MKTLTTALFATALMITSNAALANDDTIVTGVSSVNLSAEVDAQLFPTDLPLSIGDRVNYSIDNSPVSKEVKAELFPQYNS